MSRNSESGDSPRVVRHRGEHNVSRRQMDPDALQVMYRLMRNGFTAYLVGGGVRDLLLGQQPKDFDVATDAHPRQIRRLFRNSFLIGRRFRLVHVRFGDKFVEVSTFRRRPEETVAGAPAEEAVAGAPEDTAGAEDAGGADRLLQESDNTFGTPVEDAWRRDFTINALFYDIRTFAIIDHVGGLRDLDDRLIRSIGDPNERFPEDPVRMVRAVRFAARLDFRIERETDAAILRHHEKLLLSAPPRLLEEIYKLFPFACGETAFRLLRRTRLLAVLFPEIDAFLDRGGPETAWFWKHLAELDRQTRANNRPPDAAMIFAVLYLSLFLETLRLERRQDDFVRHAGIARALVEPCALRYRMPKRVFYRTLQLLDGQRRFEGPGKRFSRRFAAHEVFGDLLALRRSQILATGGDLATLEPWLALYADVQREQAEHPPREGRRGRGRGRHRRHGRNEAGAGGLTDDAPAEAADAFPLG